MSSARALKLASRELSKIADTLSRPLADEINLIAEDLAAQAAAAADMEKRRDTFRHASAQRSGANGSAWPRIEKALSDRGVKS